MVDNRDVLLMDDWSPPERRVTIEQVQHSFQLEVGLGLGAKANLLL